jgi:hypothetical protein
LTAAYASGRGKFGLIATLVMVAAANITLPGRYLTTRRPSDKRSVAPRTGH